MFQGGSEDYFKVFSFTTPRKDEIALFTLLEFREMIKMGDEDDLELVDVTRLFYFFPKVPPEGKKMSKEKNVRGI